MLNKQFRIMTAVLSAFFLSACAGAGSANQEALVVALRAEPTSLDPQMARDIPSASVMTQIFSTLVSLGDDMTIHPYLAQSWVQIDPLTYEFHLRDDVTFHNGEPLTASDVAFSIKRAVESPATAPIMGPIDPEGIEVVDELTVRISTLQPFAPLLFHLTQNGASIVPEAAVLEAGDRFGHQPIGTGPFRFSNWETGERVELIRYDDYFGDVALVPNLTMRFITEASTRFISLETGEAHIAVDVAPSDLNRIVQDNNLILVREPDLRINYFGMNVNRAPFDQIEVRQAVNYAIDTQLLIDTVLEGVGGFTHTPLAPAIFGSDPSLPGFEYNPDRAKELLAEAGFSEGISARFYIDSDPLRVALATAISNQLAQIGIQAEIVTLEWATFLEQTGQGQHDLFILGWTNSTGDADSTLFPLFHSDSHGALGNRTFFNHERVNELIDLGRTQSDPEARLALYRELQEIVIQEAIWVPLFTGENLVAYRNNVQGFRANPTNLHRYHQVSFAP